jgi:hypothetical protein
MFSAFVDVLFVPVLEVDYGVVSDLSDERVLDDKHLIILAQLTISFFCPAQCCACSCIYFETT